MIQLGFCVAVTEDSPPLGHTSADWSQWDGGQVGGLPSWLEPRHIPKQPLHCLCNHAECPCYQNRMLSDEKGEDSMPQQLDTTVTTTTKSSKSRRPTLLHFLGQLYAPETAQRFHRTLYLFGCPRCRHVECHFRIRVLRTQLPKINPYWPAEAAASWTSHLPDTTLCVVCRFPAVGKCPVTQQRFCTREHQQRYFRCVHRKLQTEPFDGGDDAVEHENVVTESFQGIYSVTEMVVEEEPPLPQVVELEDNVEHAVDTLFPSGPEAGGDDDDSDDDDEQLEQDDLNAITGAGGGTKQSLSHTKVDKAQQKQNQAVFTEFTRRITERPNCRDQVLRYNCAWPDGASDPEDDENDLEPLWMRDDHRPDTIPSCPVCGTARQFEFQLLPQFLQYLKPAYSTASATDHSANLTTDPAVLEALRQTETVLAETAPVHIPPALVEQQQRLLAGRRRQWSQQPQDQPADWGVVVVYTCPNPECCSPQDHPLGAYSEEFAWVQPPIDGQEWG